MRIKKEILVKQHDIKDCGAACVASVAAYYGLTTTIAKIRQICHTDTKGTSVLGMVEGLENMGFNAKGVKGDEEALLDIPLPAIAHVMINNEIPHFQVIYKVTKNKVFVMEPVRGEIEEYSLNDFLSIWTGILVLLEPNKYFEKKDDRINLYSRLWNLIYPHKIILIEALIGAIIYTLLGLSTSIYIQKITDYVLIDGNIRLLNLLSFIMIFIIIFQIFINVMKSILVLQTGQQIDRYLILGYYKHLLRLPQRFFDTMKVGEITSRISDAVKIRVFINDSAMQILVNVFIVIFSFILMFTYYWKLALVASMVVPLYLFSYWLVNKFNKKVERKLMENGADLESNLVESLNSIKTIKQFGIEINIKNKIDIYFSKMLKSIYKSVLNTIFSINSSEFLSRIFTVLLLWIGSIYVIEKKITPGELLSFYALIGYFTLPVSQLININKTVQNALIASDRLFEIMDLEREETVKKIDIRREDIGDIKFIDVDFNYGSRVNIFKKFNCVIKKGHTTAIIGESGSGKSTLVSLIQNLYKINDGKVLIGNHDIGFVSNYSLRSLISVVPQQIQLFSGNVIENIALGDEMPNIEKVMEISKKLGILDFIEKLPDGFFSIIGENGAFLSGGQKQRLAIARALYKNPEILILDEATSSIDTDSESVIQEVIQELSNQKKTIIIIAHRLSTIMNADTIFIMKNGKIIEQGNHKELLSKDSVYSSMWKKQSLNL